MGPAKHLVKHLWMCAPMLVIAAILLASGVGVVAILPVLACVLMMTVMMGAMGRSGDQDRSGRRTADRGRSLK